jgi:purine-binding chemotaxis protein CheW
MPLEPSPRPASRAARPPPGQYLSFVIARASYAVAVTTVREIIEYPHVTRLPSAPACIHGLVHLRGRVVPVVDLAVKFGQPALTPGRRTCIVVVEVAAVDGGDTALGLLADEVSQVLDLTEGELSEPPALGAGLQTRTLLGLARVGEQMHLVLDVRHLLTAGELADTEAAGDAPAEPAEAAASPASPASTEALPPVSPSPSPRLPPEEVRP